MIKLFKFSIIIGLTFMVIGCGGRIEQGHVGVRYNFNKTVNAQEVPEGWYGAMFTSVDEAVVKETELAVDNLQPKAADNLKLEDLDVSIYYKVNPSKAADLFIKYSGMNAYVNGLYYPAFNLIERISRGSIFDSVSKFNSLTLHTERSELESSIKNSLQEELDLKDRDTFTITSVVVRQLNTDKTLEKAIQQTVRVEKQIEAKRQEVELAKAEAERLKVESSGQAEANIIIAKSITSELLQLRQIEATKSFAKAGTHTVVLPSDAKTLVSIGK